MYGGSLLCDPVGTAAHLFLRVPAFVAACGCAYMLMGSPTEPCDGKMVRFERGGQTHHACVVVKTCGDGRADASDVLTPTTSCG